MQNNNNQVLNALIAELSTTTEVNHEFIKEYFVTTKRLKLIEESYRKSCIEYKTVKKKPKQERKDHYYKALVYRSFLTHVSLKRDRILNNILISSNNLSKEEQKRLESLDFTHPSEKLIKEYNEELTIYNKILEGSLLTEEHKYFINKHINEVKEQLASVESYYVSLDNINDYIKKYIEIYSRSVGKCQHNLLETSIDYAEGKIGYWKMVGNKTFYNEMLQESQYNVHTHIEFISEIVGVYLTEDNWND